MAVSKRTRFEVLRRDDYTCRYCRSNDNPLTVDHVVPVALGGGDDPSNLVAACRDCNAGKSSATPDQDTVAQVDHDAALWAAAMKAASEIAAKARQLDDSRFGEWVDSWNRYTYNDGSRVPIPPGAKKSVLSMLDSGLTIDDLADAIDSTMSRTVDDRFRYFCGVAWRLLSHRQELAKSLIEEARRGIEAGA